MSKKIQFNIQGKGGAGKSFYTYLQSLKSVNDESVLFIDLDSSTRSLVKNSKFLAEREPVRLISLDLLDEKKKLVRDKIIVSIEELIKDFDTHNTFILDFGAPESEQLIPFLANDFPFKDMKAFESHLGVKFVFNIIIAGGTAYESCVKYLNEMQKLLNGEFEVNILVNEFTFYNFQDLALKIKTYAADKKNKINEIKFFGDIDNQSDIGKNIIQNIEQGGSYEDLSFAAKLKMNHELEKI
jgi:hypothetical protein